MLLEPSREAGKEQSCFFFQTVIFLSFYSSLEETRFWPVSKIPKIFNQKLKRKREGGKSSTLGWLVCKVQWFVGSLSLCWLTCWGSSRKLLRSLVNMVRGWLFRLVTVEGRKTLWSTECALLSKCGQQGHAARTVSATKLCPEKPILGYQLPICLYQRKGNERNGLEQQKIWFI